MGNAGEVIAEDYAIARAAQDAFALNSHRKAAEAAASGAFDAEMLGIELPGRRGAPSTTFDARRIGPRRYHARSIGRA